MLENSPYLCTAMMIPVAHPNSEHHMSSYRVDLGYFKDSRGIEYQLGITDASYEAMWGHTCNYTITGEEPQDYGSMDMRYLLVYKNQIVPDYGECRNELYRRAIKLGFIDRNKLMPIWMDENGSQGTGGPHPGEGYLEFNEYINWLINGR